MKAARRSGFALVERFALQGHGLRSARSQGLIDIPREMRAVVQVGYGAPSQSLDFAKVPVPAITPHDV